MNYEEQADKEMAAVQEVFLDRMAELTRRAWEGEDIYSEDWLADAVDEDDMEGKDQAFMTGWLSA